MAQSALFIGGTKGLGLEMAHLSCGEGIATTILGRSAKSCSLVVEGKALGERVDLEAENPRPHFSHPNTFDIMVWTAGVHQQGSVLELMYEDIGHLCRNHLEGPINLLIDLLRHNRKENKPCHLVVIGSSSAYTARDDQAVYGALKAGKAQFARNLGRELPRTIPGSKVMLANPGGMATPFWKGREHLAEGFMDPAAVARLIWDEMKRQASSFLEIHIDRQPDSSPKLGYGARLPK